MILFPAARCKSFAFENGKPSLKRYGENTK
jgi:hypothetical protein